jgi:hypothetical protein
MFCFSVYLTVLPLGAAEPAPLPVAAPNTARHAVIEPGSSLGEKARVHRFEKLRAGAIKTEKGWNVQDFASSFFNPNREPILVTMKMVCDDPKFLFSNGQVGTFTKAYRIRPMHSQSDNIYLGSPTQSRFCGQWPVGRETNFTGSLEFSSSKPFYYYMLRETEVGLRPDVTAAYFSAWDRWADDVPAAWDDDFKQFVVPYTNYWHNDSDWPVGWYSLLRLKNGTSGPVTYTIRHVPSYGALFDPKRNRVTHYREQVARLSLPAGEEKQVALQDLFGWAADQMSAMEGHLFILPDRDAKTETVIHLSVIPNVSGQRLRLSGHQEPIPPWGNKAWDLLIKNGTVKVFGLPGGEGKPAGE